jgi:hypothetical protein
MRVEISSRRLVLHGALAAGCSLIVPITLFSSAASGADSATPEATKKLPPASVQYQTEPKGELKCGGCANFIAKSNTCKLVAGKISANGWCSLWTKKA